MSCPLAPWRAPLSRSLHLNRSAPDARYCQLATLTPENKPANRTVVFRGFQEKTNRLQVVTDARSQKVPQIRSRPHGEICWYFPKTREQFRLSGTISLVGPRDPGTDERRARERVWRELSGATRIQFAWPPPGGPRDDNPSVFRPEPPSETEPLENFYLLLLDPAIVDHLQLGGSPPGRVLYTLDSVGCWRGEPVNP